MGNILDIGNHTIKKLKKLIKKSSTILWNGPLGMFENPEFELGTKLIGKYIAKSKAFSVVGGGDTISAIEKFNIKKNISYVSTGGGSFIAFMEGKKLPTIKILEKRKI